MKNIHVMTLFFVFSFWSSNLSAAKKEGLSELISLTSECRHTIQISICRQALLQTEVLQRQAESNGNYACQSRLLGLGAELLMLSSGGSQEGALLSVPILKEVKIFCRGL